MKVYLDTYVLQVSFAKQREAIPSKHKYEVPNYSNMSKPLHTNTKVVSEFEINNYTNKRKASHDSSNSDFKRNGSKNVYDRKQCKFCFNCLIKYSILPYLLCRWYDDV